MSINIKSAGAKRMFPGLFGGAKQWDMRQLMEAAAEVQEIPAEHEEEFLCCAVTMH